MLIKTIFGLLLALEAIVPLAYADRCSTEGPVDPEGFESMISVAKKKRQFRLPLCKQCVKIDTYFTVFQSTKAGTMKVDQSVIDNQINVLNDRFRDTPFVFDLLESQIIVNETYYNFMWDYSDDIGRVWRRGGRETLNAYFGGVDDETSFAIFPDVYPIDKAADSDGAFNLIGTMPDVNPNEYDCCRMGVTLVHEVGHWLGLHHTFRVDSDLENYDACQASNVNDFVDDTPIQANNSGNVCPLNRDSCPNLPGYDPIHNYMDYSNDECYSEFTPGQIERMWLAWNIFRVKGEACEDHQVLFGMEYMAGCCANETNWQISSSAGVLFNQIDQGHDTQGEYEFFGDEIFTQDICLDNGVEYTFTLFDNVPGDDDVVTKPPVANNGLEEGAYFALKVGGNEIVRFTGDFGEQISHTFTTPGTAVATRNPVATPPPTLYPTPFSPSSPFADDGDDDDDEPILSPSSAPQEDTSTPSVPSICFSGSTFVEVEGRGQVRMSDLKVGDRVLVAPPKKFERVYSFGHRGEEEEANFVRLLPSQLELSTIHLVFVEGRGFIPASKVEVGDRLNNGQEVEGIEKVTKKGVYNPFTPSGTIMVNGVKSSNYIGFQESEVLMLGSLSTPFTIHWLSHRFQFFHRVWCHWVGFIDDHNDGMDGLSDWSRAPFEMSQWYLRQNSVVMGVLLVPFLILLLCGLVVESFFLYPFFGFFHRLSDFI